MKEPIYATTPEEWIEITRANLQLILGDELSRKLELLIRLGSSYREDAIKAIDEGDDSATALFEVAMTLTAAIDAMAVVEFGARIAEAVEAEPINPKEVN